VSLPVDDGARRKHGPRLTIPHPATRQACAFIGDRCALFAVRGAVGVFQDRIIPHPKPRERKLTCRKANPDRRILRIECARFARF
jgi:hypothetical protein